MATGHIVAPNPSISIKTANMKGSSTVSVYGNSFYIHVYILYIFTLKAISCGIVRDLKKTVLQSDTDWLVHFSISSKTRTTGEPPNKANIVKLAGR